VDALLEHFREVGFEGAPRALGYDESGRQVLSFVEGLVDLDPSDLDVSRLTEVGRLIRCLHDASSTFIPPADTVWNVAITPDKEDLICHHDLAPWNLVRTPTELTFIDWDNAGPGSRLWDLAYAAHGFVPLSPDASISDEVAGQRLAALVESYDLDAKERGLLVDMLGPRIRSMYELLRSGHETGTQPWNRLWNEGHGTVWLADTAHVDERRSIWASALGLTADSTS
jgi:Ser/Thr protein kinase RdoA (MazF antagonist)